MLAPLLRKRFDGEALTGEEQLRLDAFYSMQWNVFENSYEHMKAGVGYNQADLQRALHAFLRQPGTKDTWKVQQQFVGAEFKDYVNLLIAEAPES